MVEQATIKSKAKPELLTALDVVRDNSVTVTEAAARSGRSYNAFRRVLATGEIPTFEFAGQTRIWLADL